MTSDPNGIATDEEIAGWFHGGELYIRGTAHVQLSRAVNRIRADSKMIAACALVTTIVTEAQKRHNIHGDYEVHTE